MAFRHLFVIIDPTREDQPALARAHSLALARGGHIHAYCCVYDAAGGTKKSEIRQQALDKLNTLLEPLASDNVAVTAEVDWAERWHEAAVVASARIGAELIVKSVQPAASGGMRLSARADYYILRNSPSPVLLVSSSSTKAYRSVLAALALEDNDRKHDVLNGRVIAASHQIASSTTELQVVSALEGTPNLAQILRISEDQDAQKLSNEQLVSDRFGVTPENVHIDYGPAKAVIVETIQRTAVDLLVMGTIARRGISGALVGNTCEKVLNAVDIDTLIVN